MDHVMPDAVCPACGYVSDRAAPADDNPAPPEKGDITVCFGCGTILVYDACDECGDLLLRTPSLEEVFFLEANHQDTMREVARVQQAILNLRASERPSGPLN